MDKKKALPGDGSQILLYQAEDGQTKIEVKLQNETVWLTQDQMAVLFQKSPSTINEHIQNVYREGELIETETLRKFGNPENSFTKPRNYYNLDIIISVGYRVKSHRGTQFRIWATQRLKEYIVKGFVMNDERLEEGRTIEGGINYFNELLERVRKIRASEKNLYEKVKDIFATSIDYDPKTDQAKEFFSTVQNKFHYAITGETAAEIIVHRIDSKKDNLGLTSWKGTDVKSEDAKVAKNYMLEKELRQLGLLVEQFLSFSELQISLERPMYMTDWQSRLDEFLAFNKLKILKGKGSVSREQMEKIVKNELGKYHVLPKPSAIKQLLTSTRS